MSDYERLLETGEEYDVIIYAGENDDVKELHAHSNILRTRSQYFRTGLSKEWTTKKDDKIIFKKPNISPHHFKIILRFLYSGNIDLTQLEGLDVLKLSIAVDELNIQSLISYTQEYFIDHQDEFLRKDPVEILEITYNNELFTDLWNSCLDKICIDPYILIDFDNFIDLKSNILKILLKRDDFYLDEIVIWESLIKWCLAKHPSISKNVIDWNKKEIDMMKNTIQIFISLIRFYQISSDDFFYKVLPYKKLLPKQLIYEISKFHLVSKKNSNVLNNNLLFPRQSYFIKYDTDLIVSQHFDIFASWINKKEISYYNIRNIPYKFKLIYRASRDGQNHTAFYQKNYNIKMTITVAKVKDSEQIIGGYNPLTWDYTNSYKSTRDSFIFSFKNRKYLQTAKVGYVNYDSYERAIRPHSRKVPSFGAGADLYCTENGTTWESRPQSYPKIDDIPRKFEVEEVECYQVITKDGSSVLSSLIML
ncbi:hypothetical protein C1645_742571 [Glomus cerebriforme]|uniref:BTB/POZ domain-containing protein n=1 Tax=Glomus cerebriforme TaxID=658196 RepID=A0A397SGU2_9GLOM|nr:hypothetical protein C1645_742571 [Glomus cerebriforme]